MSASSRRFLIPEVVQTSAMDCGPAALKCLLGGFGLEVSYGRLREACQTSVDGTSIDTLEQVARALGLDVQQIMVPSDHVLLDSAHALPAIMVVRLASGVTHFVVAWRRLGGLVQVMDPAVGRVWQPRESFLERIYQHHQQVPAAAWRTWAGGDEFTGPLRARLRSLGLSVSAARARVDRALADSGWTGLGALDAATRMTASLVAAKAVRGGEVARLLDRLRDGAHDQSTGTESVIPAPFWSVRPVAGGDGDALELRGAVLVRARGRQPPAPAVPASQPTRRRLTTELQAAVAERKEAPASETLRLLRADGVLAPAVLLAGLLVAAATVVVEALLLRGLVDVGSELVGAGQRLGAVVALLVFLVAASCLDLALVHSLLDVGRSIELRLRTAFLSKLPRLGDRYFASRLSSDMAERSHLIHRVHQLPQVVGTVVRSTFEIVLTTAGIIWLSPSSAWLAIVTALSALLLPLLCQPLLIERDLRLRNHAGALSRFYLDAMLGLSAVRTHGAEPAVKREHEGLLVTWVSASLHRLRAVVGIEAAVFVLGFTLAAALLFRHLESGRAGSLILLTYWALHLPLLGERLSHALREYPALRNATLRILEPIGAPEEPAPKVAVERLDPGPGAGVAIRYQGVGAFAGGHAILRAVDIELQAGEHVAVVGPSGAGKSTLVGMLLGWHRPERGQIHVDGQPLDAARLEELRAVTAWVDPSVQIWNRSLLENLRYGARGGEADGVAPVLEAAALLSVVDGLPDGLQTMLGEGGGLVSGGEGQRVRLGRAMLRPDARLAILDEPFRGLDRALRRDLLKRARALWARATLLCVTHDVGQTTSFDRVLVVAAGEVVEDGPPAVLRAREGGHYRSLLAAEEEVRASLWQEGVWRRVRLAAGRLEGDAGPS